MRDSVRHHHSRSIPSSLATIGLLVLFPGYFLYHFALANGWVPPFAGGLFGSASLVLVSIFLPLIPWAVFSQAAGAVAQTAAVAGAVFFFGLWAAAHYIFLGGESYVETAFTQAVTALVLWIAMIFVGAFVSLDTAVFRRVLVGLSLLILVSLLYSMVESGTLLGPYIALVSNDLQAGYSSYQGLGRSISVTAIFLAGISQPRYYSLIFIIGVVAILSIGSRSDFFTLGLLTVVLAFIADKRAARRVRMAVFIGLPSVMIALWPVVMQSRFAEIFDLSRSTSWQARLNLTSIALEVVHRVPILGDFGYQAREMSVAAYAHNALSAWTTYGLAGFVIYVSLIVYFTILSFKNLLQSGGTHPIWFIAFFLNAMVVIEAIATTSVFSVLPALAWGVAINALRWDYDANLLLSGQQLP